MRNFAKLFGKSPFSSLQTHLKTVSRCLEKLTHIISLLDRQNMAEIESEVALLSKLEHDADITKNDIRNHLPKSIFLPMDKQQFLDVLRLQDSIADKAEDVGQLLTLASLEKFDLFKDDFRHFYNTNLEAFLEVKKIVEQMEDLLESSFGGIEAQLVKTLVESTAHKEHEADILQHAFLKRLFAESGAFSPAAFYLWMRVMKEVGEISNISENLANRIRMALEIH